jgi:mobilization protein NikA
MDAKKGKTRKESTPIKVWVTPEEKAAIAAKADAHSLSASGYLRRLGLAMPLQSTIDQRAILDLVKINADLGRFGGLIKMWLTTNADFESLSAQGLQRKLENTLSDVRQLQKKMSARLEDL